MYMTVARRRKLYREKIHPHKRPRVKVRIGVHGKYWRHQRIKITVMNLKMREILDRLLWKPSVLFTRLAQKRGIR